MPKSPFTPKLISHLDEGYRLDDLRADALAGLTVAIVALPLSMAIAIASGVGPERGLYTAIIGGFLVSLLGGSRYQIGGPAGAFIVLIAACVGQIGLDGLILATMLSGVFLVVLGVFAGGHVGALYSPCRDAGLWRGHCVDYFHYPNQGFGRYEPAAGFPRSGR